MLKPLVPALLACLAACQTTAGDDAVDTVEAAMRLRARLAERAGIPPLPAADDPLTLETLGALAKRVTLHMQNIASAKTIGYKRSRTVQAEASLDTSPGALLESGRPLDVAISGAGFLRLRLPDGAIGYTRDGHLQTDVSRRLVAAGGHLVLPPITIPQNAVEIQIERDGTIEVTTSGTPRQILEVARLQLARFLSPAQLEPWRGAVYLATERAGKPFLGNPGKGGFGEVRRGFLEKSNVDLAAELAELEADRKTYDALSRSVLGLDERDK